MVKTRMIAAAFVLAVLAVGCGPSEADRRAGAAALRGFASCLSDVAEGAGPVGNEGGSYQGCLWERLGDAGVQAIRAAGVADQFLDAMRPVETAIDTQLEAARWSAPGADRDAAMAGYVRVLRGAASEVEALARRVEVGG